MRVLSLVTGLTYLASLLSLSLAQAAEFDETPASDTQTLLGPQIEFTAYFPETNPFGHIVNGERNLIKLGVENQGDHNVTLVSFGGSISHATTGALIKNTTVMPYMLRLISGVKLDLAYSFHSEFKPGDVRLTIWGDYTSDEQNYRANAFDSIVTVVEPEKSALDIKLLITYLIVIGLFGGVGYTAYLTFVPQPKKQRKKAAPTDVSAPVSVTATGSAGYQEEWIPEHHLKKVKKTGAVSSDGETSGTDAGKRRKGRK